MLKEIVSYMYFDKVSFETFEFWKCQEPFCYFVGECVTPTNVLTCGLK